jgi:raffinose/stachyose/melibiose transport system permease protein
MGRVNYRLIDTVTKYFFLLVLIVLLLIMLFPFFMVTLNALKTEADFSQHGPLALPQQIVFTGIVDYWNRVEFGQKLINSTVISLSVAVLGVVLSLFNAFALGIGRVRGRMWLLIFFVVANFLPQESLAYPIYYFAKFLKLYDKPISVILVYMVIQSAFGTYLLTSVFSAFPKELIEAALIDGCSKIRLLISVVFPLSMPTLTVLFVFFFIWTWNEFFLPLVLLPSNAVQTVPIALAINQGQYLMNVTAQSASGLLGLLPCLLFFLFFQRTLTKGITAGSIK